MDLVEVEVLEGEPAAARASAVRRTPAPSAGPRRRARSRRRRSRSRRGTPAAPGRAPSAHSSDASSTTDAPSVSGVELPAVIVAASPAPEDRLQLGELLHRRVGAQVLVALDAAERRELVVEEARGRTPPRGAGATRRRARPAPRGAICHSSAVSAACSPIDSRVRGSPFCGISSPMSPGRIAPSAATLPAGVAGGVDLHQLPAQPVADRDRRVRGGVGATGDADVDTCRARSCSPTWIAACSPVPHACWMSMAGRLRRELRAEHRLAGQVEVAGVLEHRAGDHLADPLALRARTARPARRARR